MLATMSAHSSFPIGGLDTRHLARSRDNRLAGAGVAMPPRVFPGDVDVEPDMAVVLNAAHVQTATDQLGDELLDKGCLAGIMTPDDGDRGAGELHSCALSFRVRKSIARGLNTETRSFQAPGHCAKPLCFTLLPAGILNHFLHKIKHFLAFVNTQLRIDMLRVRANRVLGDYKGFGNA